MNEIEQWRTNSKAFSEVLINGLSEGYAKDKPDLVERIAQMIDEHVLWRGLLCKQNKSIYTNAIDERKCTVCDMVFDEDCDGCPFFPIAVRSRHHPTTSSTGQRIVTRESALKSIAKNLFSFFYK